MIKISKRTWFDRPETITKGRGKGQTVLMLYMALKQVLQNNRKVLIINPELSLDYIQSLGNAVIHYLSSQENCLPTTIEALQKANFVYFSTSDPTDIEILIGNNHVDFVYIDNGISQGEIGSIANTIKQFDLKIVNSKIVARSYQARQPRTEFNSF